MVLNFKVFTMNIWDMPFGLSKDRAKRMEALAEALISKEYDVVCLQEVWVKGDFDVLASKMKNMPYKYYFLSGLVGSGLAIISKWPITRTFYYKFPLNGYVHKVHHGDWLAGKGVGLAQLDVGGKTVNVYNIHLHAQYCEDNDEYHAHRLSQAYETGMLIKLSTESAALTLLVGDCNSKPDDICMRFLRTLAGLKDSFLDFQNEKNYGTNESERNSYSPPKQLEKNPFGGRLDYILFKSNSSHNATSISYDFALPSRIPGTKISYSDHEAIEAAIELKETDNTNIDEAPNQDLIKDSIGLCLNAINTVSEKGNQLGIIFLIALSALTFLCFPLPTPFNFLELSPYACSIIFTPLFGCIAFFAVLYRIEYQSLHGTSNSLLLLKNSK